MAEVIIGKQRHGPIGTVKLSFNDDTVRFGNLAYDAHYAAFDGELMSPLIEGTRVSRT